MLWARKNWSYLARLIQLGNPGSVDPSNFVYYLCVIAVVQKLPRVSSLVDFIDRFSDSMPQSQLEKLVAGKRCEGHCNDAGDFLESILGVCHPSDPNSVRMKRHLATSLLFVTRTRFKGLRPTRRPLIKQRVKH